MSLLWQRDPSSYSESLLLLLDEEAYPPLRALHLRRAFLCFFLLVLKLLFKGFYLLNGVVILFVASDTPTLAAVTAVLA